MNSITNIGYGTGKNKTSWKFAENNVCGYCAVL
jgi:hypothetical protein